MRGAGRSWLAACLAHSVDVTAIRLHLLRSGLLKKWLSEVDIRARSDLTSYGHAKDYDSIMTVALCDRLVKVALEYDR